MAADDDGEERRRGDGTAKRLLIKGCYVKNGTQLVEKVFASMGFVLYKRISTRNAPLPGNCPFDAMWAIRLTADDFAKFRPHQRVNFMPGMAVLCRKSRLHACMQRAIRQHGAEHYPFWPLSYQLPAELDKLQQYWQQHSPSLYQSDSSQIDQSDSSQVDQSDSSHVDQSDSSHVDQSNQIDQTNQIDQIDQTRLVWILKPPGSSCGRKIRFLQRPEELAGLREYITLHSPVAQRYITDPILVDGFKCTLRVYVAVTSVDPMRIYVYPEGLVRICSKRFELSPESFGDAFQHIDSIDLNLCRADDFAAAVTDPLLRGRLDGLRMRISDWLAWLQAGRGLDAARLWADVQELVVKSVLSGERHVTAQVKAQVKQRHQSYDMLGFDVLVDEQHRPWLLEINHTPSLAPHTDLENAVKEQLIASLLLLADCHARDTDRVAELTARRWSRVQAVQRRIADEPATVVVDEQCTRLVAQLRQLQLRRLVETELELARCQSWQLVFPSPTDRYHPFMMHNNNVVVHQWLKADLRTCIFDS